RAEPHADAHPREHLRHPRTHVVRDDDLDAVLLEESRDARVMLPFRSRVVGRSPADVDLLPALDAPVLHRRDRDALRASPPRVDLAVARHRDADRHGSTLRRLDARMLGCFSSRAPASFRMLTIFVCWPSARFGGTKMMVPSRPRVRSTR